MKWFKHGDDPKKRLTRNPNSINPLLSEEFGELRASGQDRDFDKAGEETRALLSRAAMTDIKNILLLDQGRCPACHAKTENFLFTVVCPTCGWFRRDNPGSGACLVMLRSGDHLEADYIHHGSKGEILCIVDGVVVSELNPDQVVRIDYLWDAVELEQAKAMAQRVRRGICSWCEGSLEDTPVKEHGEDYVALGPFQERHVFCSEKCQRSFRKRYPSRVHRNCYETDCADCELCIKRFDCSNYKRRILK
jgi:hypothetical protein